MKKLYVRYNDGSSVSYSIKDSINHLEYVGRHIHDKSVDSIVLKCYPASKHDKQEFVNKK